MGKKRSEQEQVFDRLFAPSCFGELKENITCNLMLRGSKLREMGCKFLEECTQEAIERSHRGNTVEEGRLYQFASQLRRSKSSSRR